MEALLADGGGRRRRRDARRWPPPSPQSLLQSSMPPPLPPPLPSAPPSTPPSPQRPLPPDAPHGRGPLGTVKPPPPPSIPKAHCSRSRHPGRRHRPCRHLDRNLRLCRAWRRVWEGLMALPPPHGHGSARQRSRPSLAPMCKNNNNRYCGSFLNKLLSPNLAGRAGALLFFSPPRPRRASRVERRRAHTHRTQSGWLRLSMCVVPSTVDGPLEL